MDKDRLRDKEVSRPGQKELDSTKTDIPSTTSNPPIIYIIAFRILLLELSLGPLVTYTKNGLHITTSPSRLLCLGSIHIYLTCRTVSQTSKLDIYHSDLLFTSYIIYHTSSLPFSQSPFRPTTHIPIPSRVSCRSSSVPSD